MKYSPPISDSQNIPLSRSFSLWATIFFIAVLAPAFLLSNLLENLKEELVHAKFEDHLNHARALMAKLDKELDPISIIQEALEKFRKKVEIKAVSQNLNSKSAAIFDQVFRKIFPESSKIFWFDPNQNLIHLEGNPQIAGGRTWQTFFSLLSGKPISDLEKRLASNLVLTVFGELVTVNYLKGAFRQAIEVLIGGEKNLFSILRFKNGDMILGYSLVFIPLSRAPPGWELEHVIRIHGNQNEMVGGFWKSKQDGNGSGILNSGLMHGLSESMTSSYSCWIGESFVYAQPRSQDPDFI
ncbi:hypothetical protein HYY75_05405, partial [bacterium]|nr:hypothetical protein [bacterium]